MCIYIRHTICQYLVMSGLNFLNLMGTKHLIISLRTDKDTFFGRSFSASENYSCPSRILGLSCLFLVCVCVCVGGLCFYDIILASS